MHETIVILEESYTDMVSRTTEHYSKRFDRTWNDVLTSVRRSQKWQPLSDDIKKVLAAYKPMFRKLKKRERELFTLTDRMSGLSLCRELHSYHLHMEKALYDELRTTVRLSDKQKRVLLRDRQRRTKRLHAMHREVRLAIDQGQIILADAKSKTGHGDADLLEAAGNEGLRYFDSAIARLSGLRKPVHD